jgi:catechol 2,3-dioxygenase-like lactoylglutathione lyase family enzyme
VALHHVTLELDRADVEACLAFYELLGFERVEAPDALHDRAAWLQSGGNQLHLMWVEDPVPLARGHIAVVAPEYEDVLDRLRRAGHELEPRRQHWGSPRAYVRDPAGNLVEVIAFPPPG